RIPNRESRTANPEPRIPNPESRIPIPVQCRVRALATALGLSLIGSCGGLLVASSLLFFPGPLRVKLIPWLVSYAVGALLGVALLALLPEALAELPPSSVFSA